MKEKPERMSKFLLDGLKSVDTEMDRLEYRSKHRENILVDKVVDLNIHWKDQGKGVTRSGYFARVGNRDMPMSDGAVQTACRLIKTEPKYFAQFSDREKFPRAMRKGIDDGNRRDKGLLLRHNGINVTAILPQDYKIHDASQIMNSFIEPLRDNIGDIRGMQSLEQNDGDICAYRIVLGANIMPSLSDLQGQFMAFFITMSENGIIPTSCTLGLYRAECTNTAMRRQTIMQWDHRGIGFTEFYNKVATVIHKASYFQTQYSAVFENLMRLPLGDVPAADMIAALLTNRLITRAHADNTKLYLGQTDDGRQVTTQYDLFNVLTRAARDLPGVQAREYAESKTLGLFDAPGGLAENLRRAHASMPKKIAIEA